MFNFGFLLEGEGGGGGGSMLISIGMIVVLFVVLYFFMIRPQKKQEKKDAEMRDALQVGDEVTTIGGIIGKVVSIKGETFVLETTKDKTKIRFLRGAIRSVDVKAADIAAQILETKEEKKTQDTPTEAAAPEADKAEANAEVAETTEENK
jgi:preprotein translocase subunit YajC